MKTSDDFHQSRFAGAVLAHQEMDFALADFKVAIAQRLDAAEALLNAG